MNVETPLPPAHFLHRLMSRIQGTFPTLFQLFRRLCLPIRVAGRVLRTSPSLSLLALAMLLTVGTLKCLTFRQIVRESAIGAQIESYGGSCSAESVYGHSVLYFVDALFEEDSAADGPISRVSIPAAVLNTHPEQLFSLLSQLPHLETLSIAPRDYGARVHYITAPPPPPIAPEAPESKLVDSEKLQQGLASLPRSVSLDITSYSLLPCAHPLDLMTRLNGITLEQVHISRDFARGLPIIKRGRVMIVDSRIDDNAVEIFLERIQSQELQLYRCSMSDETRSRFTRIKNIVMQLPKINAAGAGSNAEPTRAVESSTTP